MSSSGRTFTQEQAAVAQRICALSQGTYYEILELDEQANDADIKRSFKLLALQLHPDKNGAPGAEEAFKLVAEAYKVLGNPQERAAYDSERKSGLSGFYTGSYGSYASNDDFEYEDPPPYRPRTPPPNETRKQKRQREFEDRKARQREKDQAERKARRQEKERRRRAKLRDVDDVLRFFAGMGMRFVFCEHCDRVHMHLDGEPVEHDPPPHRANSASQRTAARSSPVQPRAPQQAVFEEAPAQVPVPHEARNAPRPPSDPPAGFGRRPAQQPRFSGRNAASSSSYRSDASEERPATAPERHIATAIVIAALALVAYLGYKIIAFLLRRTWGRIAFGCFAVLFLILCCPALPAEASERAKAD